MRFRESILESGNHRRQKSTVNIPVPWCSRALVFELWNEWINGHISCRDTIIPILCVFCSAFSFLHRLLLLPSDARPGFPHFRPSMCLHISNITFFRKSLSPRIDCVTLGSQSLFIFFSPALPSIHVYPSLWFVGFPGNHICSSIYVISPLPCIFYLSHWVSSVGGEKESLPDCARHSYSSLQYPFGPFCEEFCYPSHWSLERCRDFCVAVRNWKLIWLQQLDAPRTQVDMKGSGSDWKLRGRWSR